MGQIAGSLPSSVILTAAQIAQIQAAVDSYNAIIAVEAQSHGAALVNIHGILNLIQAWGVVENGQRLTTDFLGGIFSLDGVHPTNTGYAIVANAFGLTVTGSNCQIPGRSSPAVLHPPGSTKHFVFTAKAFFVSWSGREDGNSTTASYGLRGPSIRMRFGNSSSNHS